MNTELAWLKGRYIQELNSLYSGKIESLDILPHMMEVAQKPALKSAFQYHFEKTRAQVRRLNLIFADLGVWPAPCEQPPSEKLAQGADASSSTSGECPQCDAMLISAARQMERREILGYLLALNCAEILRDRPAADLLEKTLSEEYEIDQVLAGLSQPASLPVRRRTASAPRANPERVG
jgi:ferritin-like metal-binding protein YciE